MVARARAAANVHAVLLAGGGGSRFWPLSRAASPKQFLRLGGSDPLLRETWRRIRRLLPASRVWTVAPRELVSPIRKMLPALRDGNIVVEPAPRDTLPAIALACAALERRDPEAVMGVLPTDHVIRDPDQFARSFLAACSTAEQGSLVCLGVRPVRPASGYGYLRCERPPRGVVPVRVERFVEKPDRARARRFLRSGRYLWNAGMLVGRVQRFLEEFERQAPSTLRAARAALDGRTAGWRRVEAVSVDYGVMEGASDVQAVKLDAGWSDAGSWDEAARLLRGAGGDSARHVLIDSDKSVILSEKPVVALVELPGVIVVDTPDALLIVPSDRADRVREVVAELRRRNMKDLL